MKEKVAKTDKAERKNQKKRKVLSARMTPMKEKVAKTTRSSEKTKKTQGFATPHCTHEGKGGKDGKGRVGKPKKRKVLSPRITS